MGAGKREAEKKAEIFDHVNGNRRLIKMEAVLVFDGEMPSDLLIKEEAEKIFFGKIDISKGMEGRSFIHEGYRTIVESMEVKVQV